MYPSSQGKQSKTPIIVLVVVVVILAAGFGYYYFQSSGTISSQSSRIAAQAAEITSDMTTIAQDNSKVANLTSEVVSLQTKVITDEATVSSLTNGYTKANATISSLNTEVSTLNAQIIADNTQISNLNTQITTLQAQVTTLQAIADLTSHTVLVSSQAFSTGTVGAVVVSSFTANYAGYITVTASAGSDLANEGASIHNTFASSISSSGGVYIPDVGFFFIFGSVGTTEVFPVVPGTVTVFLVTSDTTAQTATVTVTFYY